MKLNWGYSIAIFYASFMVVLLYFVIKSTTHDNSLVMDNYYEQDLKYQSHFDKIVNTQGLEKQVAFVEDIDKKTIVIHFPKGLSNITGTVQLFRPSTKHKDKMLPIKTDAANQMTFSTSQMQGGRWQIKVDWKSNETSYYSEKDIEL